MLLFRLKRILIYLLESSVLLIGAVLGLSLGLVLFEYLNVRDPFPVLSSALFLAFICLLYVRRKTQHFKLRYDVARFLAGRQFGLLHPRRAKLVRTSKRVLLLLPSAWALTVLFFFPEVTHLLHPRMESPNYVVGLGSFFPKLHDLAHPGTDHLLHNQVCIPWTWTIVETFDSPARFSSVFIFIDHRVPWPFGGKYTPNQGFHLSAVSINSLSPEEVMDRRTTNSRWPQIEQAERTSRTIHGNGLDLTCSGYFSAWGIGFWNIHCETSSPLQARNLEAHFTGPADDLPAFYQLMETARPAD